MQTREARPTRTLDPEKRRAILEAAQEVFLKSGFRDASMDEVASHAGVGKMTVYRHFGSKEALFETMLAEVCAGQFPNTALPAQPDLRTELRHMGRAFVGLVTDPKRMATYRLAMAEGERFPDFGRMFYQGAVLVVLNHVAARLRAHVPGLGEVESKRTAGMFLQMVQGPAMLRLLLGVPPEPWNADFGPQIEMAADFVEGRLQAVLS